MNKKQKAIEPIVATILLVVVAVILVTIVLAWGKNFATGGLNEANTLANDSCSGAAISLETCDWNGTTKIATIFVKNTSDTFNLAANDIVCNITDDANALNNQQNIPTTSSAINAGQTIQTTCTSTTMSTAATKVTVNIRSAACPTIAVSQVKGCQ